MVLDQSLADKSSRDLSMYWLSGCHWVRRLLVPYLPSTVGSKIEAFVTRVTRFCLLHGSYDACHKNMVLMVFLLLVLLMLYVDVCGFDIVVDVHHRREPRVAFRHLFADR